MVTRRTKPIALKNKTNLKSGCQNKNKYQSRS
jgi:hypothetical protein